MRIHPRSRRLGLFLTIPIAVAACSGKGGGGMSPPTGTHYHYVADHLTVPSTSQQVNQIAIDLDGDGTPDNAFGNAIASLTQAAGLDVQGLVDASVVQGFTIVLADLQATSLTSAKNAGFWLYEGTNPNPAPCTSTTNLATCGQHLQGTGSFSVGAGTGSNEYVEGKITTGGLDAGPGSLHLKLNLVGTAIDLHLRDAHVKTTGITATTLGASVIGGAVAQSDVQGQFIPGLQNILSQIVGRDCTGGGPPSCGCMAGSQGATVITLFDANADCAITIAELNSNGTLQTLLAPDIDTDGDGTADSVSLGVGITAVGATFPQP